jgi:hypothetical protein
VAAAMTRVTVNVVDLWWAEWLAAEGYGHGDATEPDDLKANFQKWIDDETAKARAGLSTDPGRGSFPRFVLIAKDDSN